MSEVKWIKLTTDIFDDEKIKLIDALPERDGIFVIWIRLLVLAGKRNDNGTIYLNEEIPYTDEMLSTLFSRPVSIIRLSLETLKRLNMIRILDDQKIEIVNWDKHQNIEGLERIREQGRKRVAAFRERKKEDKIKTRTRLEGNVTDTLPKYSAPFKEFWKQYPHKANKSGAYSCWKARIKEGPGKVELIMKCLKNYLIKVEGKEEEYILHASTFLNKGHRFLDYENWQPGKRTAEVEERGWKCVGCGKINYNTMSFCTYCKAEKGGI